MSDEFEAVGALATAGLIAKSAGRETGVEHGADHDAACANCGAALTGPYCHVCGQRGHVHRSLLHMGEELLHGIAHFDGKVVRTLPLLAFKPGRLTRDYVEGKRATYVSPMGLFLFVVFLMFFAFSFGHHRQGDFADGLTSGLADIKNVSWDTRQAISQSVESRAKDARDALAADTAAGRDPTIAAQSVAAWEAVSVPMGGKAPGKTGRATGVSVDDNNRFTVHTGIPGLDHVIGAASKNPELALYKLKNTAYKFSFLLVPISLPFIWLLFFWRRDVTMYDHAVFALYSLSFMSLLFTVAAVLGEFSLAPSVVIGFLILLAPPVHMYKQLKYTYGLTRSGATWRTFALLVFSVIALSLFAAAILAMGLSE